MSFASPLGIGLESDGEYLDIELTEPIASNEAVRRMNEAGVEGIEVLSFLQIAEEKKNDRYDDPRCRRLSCYAETGDPAGCRLRRRQPFFRLGKISLTILWNRTRSAS